MNVSLERYTPEQWYAYAEAAHKLVFKSIRHPWLDRISFALLAVSGERILGYVTVKELDAESAYWQFGGALDESKGLAAVRGFYAFLDYCRARYKRVSTLVENTNVAYLHLLMKAGFRIIGVRCFKGEVYCELLIEFADKGD